MPTKRSKLLQYRFARVSAWATYECLKDLRLFGLNSVRVFSGTDDRSERAQPRIGLRVASVEVSLKASISWPFVLLLATTATAFELGLPIDCEVGRSCVIQNYVDHDPSPNARDYQCGTLTYDGHNGTDFRL